MINSCYYRVAFLLPFTFTTQPFFSSSSGSYAISASNSLICLLSIQNFTISQLMQNWKALQSWSMNTTITRKSCGSSGFSLTIYIEIEYMATSVQEQITDRRNLKTLLKESQDGKRRESKRDRERVNGKQIVFILQFSRKYWDQTD